MLHGFRRYLTRTLAAVGLAAVLAPPAGAVDALAGYEVAPSGVLVVINKATQRMSVYVDGELRQVFPVSTGRWGYDTPVGIFQPLVLVRMSWAPKYNNAPMPHSIYFRHGGYAIHGTTSVRQLGRRASHGCVRLAPHNAKWLYELVQSVGKERTTIRVM